MKVMLGERSAGDYRYSLGRFLKTCTKTYMDEVGDVDLLIYIATMTREGLSKRTIANRCAGLSAFMRHFEFLKAVNKKLIPKPTQKIVSAYTVEDLKSLFLACNAEERMLFQFFLGTGLREQEIQYAAWTDLSFSEGVFKVTEKLDVEFRIKDKEEREVPLPSELLSNLKLRYEKRKHQRWIFPTAKGKPDGHMLRTLQELAHRAGLNCGACQKRNGNWDTGACSRWGLHKFRKTFATFHHRGGVPLTDLQKWLGHSEMETTQASDVRSVKTRAQVDSSFAEIAA
jgi:integrase/recombinase XerD